MTFLAMTKIIVTDLERSEVFYRKVCGFDQVEWIDGPNFREAIMCPFDQGKGASLVLYADGSTPPPGEAVLVFETVDIDAFSTRLVEAGGEVTHPAQTIPELGLTFAMYRDPEGHVIEAVSRTRD